MNFNLTDYPNSNQPRKNPTESEMKFINTRMQLKYLKPKIRIDTNQTQMDTQRQPLN